LLADVARGRGDLAPARPDRNRILTVVTRVAGRLRRGSGPAIPGCGSTDLGSAVRDVVLAAAPDLVDVHATVSAPEAFIPVKALPRRPGQ
jgi:hypothetical protein